MHLVVDLVTPHRKPGPGLRALTLAVLVGFLPPSLGAIETLGGLEVFPRHETRPTTDVVVIVEVGFLGHLRIRDPETGKEGWIRVNEETELREGRRAFVFPGERISAEELKVGQTLEVKQRPDTLEVLRLRVIEDVPTVGVPLRWSEPQERAARLSPRTLFVREWEAVEGRDAPRPSGVESSEDLTELGSGAVARPALRQAHGKK